MEKKNPRGKIYPVNRLTTADSIFAKAIPNSVTHSNVLSGNLCPVLSSFVFILPAIRFS